VAGKTEFENDEVCKRYRVGSDAAAELEGEVTRADACRIVQSMANGATMWSSIYELTSGKVGVFYRAAPENEYADAIERQPGDERKTVEPQRY
jgi:hypothetical protein